ncbi:MAG: DNA repair protein RecN [Bacteroidales bacterium]|nr:DNA repair protein RecN [Bacteroidales bacterium]
MLVELQIKNYALIRSLDIRFDSGFTAITGETGAGKSILMGALSLILGNRADTTVLFDKSKKCVVEATFDISDLALESFFEKNDIDYSTTTIIRREITENGKSRAFINDTPVVLPILKELSSKLVDIHSQHNNLLLNDSLFRLKVVDALAENQTLMVEYRKAYSRYVEADKRCRELEFQQQKDTEERGYLEYTATELVNAHLSADEQESLETRIAFLSNAQTIKENLYAGYQIIENQDDSITHRLQEVKNSCQSIAEYDPRLQEFVDRLESAQVELKDLAFEISKMEDTVEVSPDELESLKERLDLIYTLEQKYRVDSVPQLLEKLTETQAKLTSFSDNQEQLKISLSERQKSYDEAVSLAENLSHNRESIVDSLEKKMKAKLQLLGMPNALFKVDVRKQSEIGENGYDKVDFLFSANKGSSPIEIAKVASGGEISRVMLSIKSIITTNTYLPTVIFDEIDTGISGDVANKTATVMAELAEQRQVLVITHLPQMAARARLHYFVYKTVEKEQTFTQIRQLAAEEREQEIAKMISGNDLTPAALQTARELMSH